MTILVTGATGAVGRHLVTALTDAGESVRAVSRHPEQAQLPSDVEVVYADLTDRATLAPELFTDVDRVFVFPGGAVDNLVAAALEVGSPRFVVLSSLAAAAEFPRDLGSSSHRHHTAVEKAVTSRSDNWAIVRPGTFANNLLSWAWPIKSGMPIRAPYLDSAQAPIHEADVADAAAALLTSDRHRGRAFPVTGPEALTRTQQVETIGSVIGRTIELVEISPEEFRAETAQFIPEGITDMLLAYWSDTVDHPDRVRSVESLTGRPGRTLAQWAADHRADFGVS